MDRTQAKKEGGFPLRLKPDLRLRGNYNSVTSAFSASNKNKIFYNFYFTSNISYRIIFTKLNIVILIHLKGGNPFGELRTMNYEPPTTIYANRLSSPHSQKVLVIPSITLFRSLSAVALAKADAFCAFLRPKNPRNQRNPWLINDLREYKSLYNCRETFTDVMSPLQISPLLCKTNPISRMLK